MSDEKTEGETKKKSSWKFRVLSFFSLLAAGVFLPTTIVLAAGMLPTLIALITDKTPNYTATYTVGSMNAAGVIPVLLKLWSYNHTLEGAFSVLGDHTNIIIMYSAALIGMVIYNNVTLLVSLMVYRRARGRMRAIENHLKNLENTWGDEVGSAVRK